MSEKKDKRKFRVQPGQVIRDDVNKILLRFFATGGGGWFLDLFAAGLPRGTMGGLCKTDSDVIEEGAFYSFLSEGVRLQVGFYARPAEAGWLLRLSGAMFAFGSIDYLFTPDGLYDGQGHFLETDDGASG